MAIAMLVPKAAAGEAERPWPESGSLEVHLLTVVTPR